MPTPEWTPLFTVIQMISAVASWHPEAASIDRQDALCLTRNIYFEARGEGRMGQYAVAAVTLNRVRENRWPGGACAVVYQNRQFSWTISRPQWRQVTIDDPKAWQRAAEVAVLSLAGLAPDYSRGATHYVAPKRLRQLPVWTAAMSVSHRIDGHVFYLDHELPAKTIPRGPARSMPRLAITQAEAPTQEIVELRRTFDQPNRQPPCGRPHLLSATVVPAAFTLFDRNAAEAMPRHRPARRDVPADPWEDMMGTVPDRRVVRTGARPDGRLRPQPATRDSICEAARAKPPARTAQSR